jgi:hypothetical protein
MGVVPRRYATLPLSATFVALALASLHAYVLRKAWCGAGPKGGMSGADLAGIPVDVNEPIAINPFEFKTPHCNPVEWAYCTIPVDVNEPITINPFEFKTPHCNPVEWALYCTIPVEC